MTRVLLLWRLGSGSVYTYLGRIDDNYKLPADTKTGTFMEGFITKDSGDLDDVIISIPMLEQVLEYAGDYQFKAI